MSSTIAKPANDCTEIAKQIRKDLKAAFPETKFSVRSDRFSLGSAVDVSWTDGPRQSDVEAIIGGRAPGRSMYVQAHRRRSDEAMGTILESLCQRYGIEFGGVRMSDHYLELDGNSPDQRLGDREYLHALAWRVHAQTDYRAGTGEHAS